MQVPSQLRSGYFNPNFALPQNRNLFPGIGLSSSDNNSPNLLNFGSSTSLHQILQTKQENRDNSVELSEEEEGIGRKRRVPAEQELPSQQLGNYLLQSGSASMAASINTSTPANFWMVANSNQHQDPIWTFPTVNNTALYRPASTGLHFMNFPTPVALLPTQQLSAGLGGGAAAAGGFTEGQLSMLAGLNHYRPIFGPGALEQQGSGSHLEVLQKMYDLGIPQGSDNKASHTLMRILGRRFVRVGEEEEVSKIIYWDFVDFAQGRGEMEWQGNIYSREALLLL
ncbi:hypothetical protein L1987_51722 [Smallanthus sonchifolius]|uniref:Uncharacterized protein n=1 Tax=Smallanthus sonchifolius TaxID=185202 RepID=A0ACB9ER73_9ASTR|nr:hypothetical protein L1987_51722 [Smallanthus sonchifolius]